ncbi:MAG: Rv2578c family radical SAM protein [Acidimicrobiales bacterium]
MADGLRWRLVEDDDERCGQGELFPEMGVLERHIGVGEYRGLEFLHVRAKRVINRVPGASRMPFGWTINAYRGCSHACSYCAVGDTPVLMADGRARPLGELRAGDQVYGTVRAGPYRRYVITSVLARWQTVEPAWRVTLEDGRQLVTSGDHRFLTERGWKHVSGSDSGHDRRPHLTTGNKLMGTGRLQTVPEADIQALDRTRDYLKIRGGLGERLRFFQAVDPAIARKRGMVPTAVESSAALGVTAVEPLGIDLPMYDITTGTGDFIADGVISHNCFARPTHEWLGLGIGEDFERRIVVKVNAVERVTAELASRRWGGDPIAMGTNTDPYQRAEGRYRLTRGIVEALGEAANPFSILTKSTLVLGDLDRLVAASRRTAVRVNLSVGTLDEAVWRASEPGTPHPSQRVAAVARINQAGVRCGVLVAPVLPGLSDHPDQIEEVVGACVDAGAVSVSASLLHLRPGVREHYLTWLASTRPDLVGDYERRYPEGRAYLPGRDQAELSDLVRRLVAARRRGPPGAAERAARQSPASSTILPTLPPAATRS